MKKTFLKAVALTAAISLGVANASLAAGGSIGMGDISVYRDGKLVSKLTGQNPIEEGALLVCNSKCVIKSEGISLIGADSAAMAVKSEEDTFKLYLKEGRVDFVINNNVRRISFITPDGTYTVAEAVFNASSVSAVKGSVIVNADGQTEINVTEGRMVFATAQGMKSVDANHKIVLAQAVTSGAGAAGAGAGAGAGAAGAGAAAGAAAGAGAAGAGLGLGGLVVGGLVAGGMVVGAVGTASSSSDTPPTTGGGGSTQPASPNG